MDGGGEIPQDIHSERERRYLAGVEGVAAGYVSPDAKEQADAMVIGDLAESQYPAIWIRRTVAADGPGYAGNTLTIACESS